MVAFYGEPRLKEALLERLREHQRLDTIMQGDYYDGVRGCHLGCITHQGHSTHLATERLFSIPKDIGYWLEQVFEGLPIAEAKRWVVESIDAIPVGADMSLALHHLAVWLLGPDSPSAEGNGNPIVREAVASVRSLHQRTIDGGTVTDEEWSAAESAASAAWLAASSAAESAASAAWLAASSAAWLAASSAAESAASSAAESAASAAWSAAWKQIAAKSIEIFAACPVVTCEQCEESSGRWHCWHDTSAEAIDNGVCDVCFGAREDAMMDCTCHRGGRNGCSVHYQD